MYSMIELRALAHSLEASVAGAAHAFLDEVERELGVRTKSSAVSPSTSAESSNTAADSANSGPAEGLGSASTSAVDLGVITGAGAQAAPAGGESPGATEQPAAS